MTQGRYPDLPDDRRKMVDSVLDDIRDGRGADEETIHHVEDNFWKKLKRVIGKVPFAKDAVALYYCMEDPHTPLAAKLTIAGALAYFIAPVDVIPDPIPGVGYADDATVIASVVAMLDTFITDEHKRKAREFFES